MPGKARAEQCMRLPRHAIMAYMSKELGGAGCEVHAASADESAAAELVSGCQCGGRVGVTIWLECSPSGRSECC